MSWRISANVFLGKTIMKKQTKNKQTKTSEYKYGQELPQSMITDQHRGPRRKDTRRQIKTYIQKEKAQLK